jgi:aryl-alcohol dehydrogenase-like predicted oxidoreductase
MEYRKFGNTDLRVSVVGFGAWAIGGPAQVGEMAIGWGPADDDESIASIHKSLDKGINFFDTADFYGLGHSEQLIGQTIGNNPDVVIATKVGQRISPQNTVVADYSKEWVLQSCEGSLRRLRRETIDFYQLHIARMPHLEQGDCIEAMHQLVKEGKVRYWGISLNTFYPEPEARFFFDGKLGHGFQVVLNLLNQRAAPVIQEASSNGLGIIARMPLQFGLLSGKFTRQTTFNKDDHRANRLRPEVLETFLNTLEPLEAMAARYGVTQASLALSFVAAFPGVTTLIPGIRTPEQAAMNADAIVDIQPQDMETLLHHYEANWKELVSFLEKIG